MKKLNLVLIFLALFVSASAQVVVSGKLTRTNGDSVLNTEVYLYSDTSVSTPIIQLMRDTTDQSGNFEFLLSNTIPGGTVFYTSALDCDNINFKVNTHIFTGNNISSPIVICVTPTDNFSGYVYLGDASKRPDKGQALVHLISKCGNSLTPLQTITTDTNGYFEVSKYPILSTGCELIMSAELKSTSSDYKKYLPAYHKSDSNYSLRWSDARDIPLQVARGGVVLTLPEAINPFGGPSKIAGYSVYEGGSQLPGKIMFITDYVDIPVDFLYTSQIGDFAFINIPFGKYKVFGDVWGKDNPDLVVSVDADHVFIDNIIFTENATKYWGRIATSVTNTSAQLANISIYPNPVGDFIKIKGAEHISGSKTVIVTDVTGAVLVSETFAESKELSLNITQIPSGVYMLNIATKEGNAVYKIVK